MTSLLFIPVDLAINMTWWSVKLTCKSVYNIYYNYRYGEKEDNTQLQIKMLNHRINFLESVIKQQNQFALGE